MGAEIELKLALPRALARAARRELDRIATGSVTELESTYYDTADRLLRAHGMALRVRRTGTGHVQTLKTRASGDALARRGEWETPAPRGRLAVARFAGTPLAALLARHRGARLAPVFTTRFRRIAWQVESPGARVEVALDRGWIESARARAPICELELELKSGAPDALTGLALRLQRAVGGAGVDAGLVPFGDSKAARGYRLLGGAPRLPVKAGAKAFGAASARSREAGAAARALTARGVELLLANAGAATPADPEFVHQARVALRRLRSMLRLLREHAALPDDERRGLRWLARELGRVRDLDVLATTTLPALFDALGVDDPKSHRTGAPGAASIPEVAAGGTADAGLQSAARRARAVLERRRARAAARLQRLLLSRRYALLVLALMHWAATAGARAAGAGDVSRAAAPVSLAEASVRRLDALHRRIAADADRFDTLSAKRQHRVRIRAKRLRYGVDLCVPERPAAAYVERLARVQDTLGALNDLATLEEALPRLSRAKRLLKRASRWCRVQRRLLSGQAQQRLQRLARAPLPWAAQPAGESWRKRSSSRGDSAGLPTAGGS
jgi:inorganic triphosphatase YgiF